MLDELEKALLAVLGENLKGLPKGNVVVGARPAKIPGVAIKSLGFEFGSEGLGEEVEGERPVSEEILSGDGSGRNFQLKGIPLKGSLLIEHPPGQRLKEGEDYWADYDKGEIAFSSPPQKGKNNISVRYTGRKTRVTLKTIKLRANYAIDVYASDLSGADSLAEKVVMSLLSSEDSLVARGIEIHPLGGEVGPETKEGSAVLRLKYLLERELRLEREVDLISRIELSNVTERQAERP